MKCSTISTFQTFTSIKDGLLNRVEQDLSKFNLIPSKKNQDQDSQCREVFGGVEWNPLDSWEAWAEQRQDQQIPMILRAKSEGEINLLSQWEEQKEE